MSFLYLTVALLAGATKGYCGKRTSGRITGWWDALLANLVRMLLCISFCVLPILQERMPVRETAVSTE